MKGPSYYNFELYCSNCVYFGFVSPTKGYGSNWFCKKHKKRIVGVGCQGKDWQDRFEQHLHKS
jgi:uncharacterized protein (DUF2252 family)